MKLICSGRDVSTVFDLLGDKENDMTFSLGWVLANSEPFLGAIVRDLTGKTWANVRRSVLKLQTSRVEHGITDIEIELSPDLVLVFEAKRGPQLPSEAQLRKYAAFLRGNSAPQKFLVALTNATPAYSDSVLKGISIPDIRVLHRSWRQVKAIAESVIGVETNTNKHWLRAFSTYLEGLLQMETRFSNWAYVVSLAQGNPPGWSISWIDIVEKRQRYFYSVGPGWPDPPPNYIAFRYGGQLRSIHHVDSYEVFGDPSTIFPEAPQQKWAPTYCLRLGPPINPAQPVPYGPRVNRAARVWCMIDTLLTSNSISDALSESDRRKRDK